MADLQITIKNGPQIASAFSKAPMIMGRNLNIAIKRSIITIQRRSMINTPVLTGRLRASTYADFGNLRGEVGTNTNYDIFVHEGTRFMQPRPYLRNAIQDSDSDVEREFEKAVEDTLNEIGNNI